MAFEQLYYTSCEHGLTGLPGYQFNAVTPGVTVEVMRAVERITSYEPPADLVYEKAGAHPEAYPVSLSFSPGEPAILANVVFTGTDFSHRFGNYFAHALVTATPGADLGDALPIETWQARFWAGSVAASPSLPALPGPLPAGPLGPDAVDEFLRRHPGRPRLPALLTAVASSVSSGERSVVLVSADTRANAAWIAAASYLLPPALVDRMSFTTYHRRPGYSPFDLVGTVPGCDLGSEPLEAFALFDFVEGRSSDLDVHPLTELLAAVGPGAGRSLWRQARALAGGDPGSLDAWLSPVAAAAALLGRRLPQAHYDGAVRWFVEQTGRGQLDPGQASAVAEALLGHAGAEDRQLREIISGVHGAGAGGLVQGLDGLEAHLVRAELERVGAARGGGPELPRVSPAARDRAARDCARLLAAAEPPGALALLRWAAGAGLELGDQVVAGTGERLARQLAACGPDAGLQRELRAAISTRPPLRRGLQEELGRLADRDPEVVQTVLGGGWGGLLGESGEGAAGGEGSWG
jgi:GTPase-associated protein 1, N-terminal domain type 2/GTPase-associated protein 1, middle domain/GTPase-associated protein 1, C-terminal domain